MTIKGEYIVPTDARAEFRKIIQRANRRVLANVNYIKENGIRDNVVKTMIAGDYSKKSKWATKSAPFSASTRFKSEAAYRDFMRHVMRWGEDTGRRGGYAADPKRISEDYKTSIYKALNGLARNNGVSLEKWGGDLPPELKKKLDDLSLEQITQFFDYVDPTGEEWIFDSDQVVDNDVGDFIEYIDGRVSALQKYFPSKPKSKKKKKSKRKNKGRKKR